MKSREGESQTFDADRIDPKLIAPQAAITGAFNAHAATASDTSAIAQSAAEAAFYDKKKDDLGAQVQKARVDDINAARLQRAIYAACTFALVLAWVGLVFYVLRLQFWSRLWGLQPFSDKVLIVFLTTTTTNIIGTFYIVLRSIFRASSTRLTGKN